MKNLNWIHKMITLDSRLLSDCEIIGKFTLSHVLLMRDANYPWLILVPRVADIEEIYQLDLEQRSQLLEESCNLAQCLQSEFGAHKLNVAALGNVVPQLHLHHIVRMREDAAWPGPIWGAVPPTDYLEKDLNSLKLRLQAALQGLDIRWR